MNFLKKYSFWIRLTVAVVAILLLGHELLEFKLGNFALLALGAALWDFVVWGYEELTGKSFH